MQATISARRPKSVTLDQVVDAADPHTWRFAGEEVNAAITELQAEAIELQAAAAGDVDRALQDSTGDTYEDLQRKRDMLAAVRYSCGQKALEIAQAWQQVIDQAEVSLRAKQGDLDAAVEKEREKSRKALLKANSGPESDPVFANAPQVAERKFAHKVAATTNVAKAMAAANDCRNELRAIPGHRRHAEQAASLAERYLADFRRRFIESAAR